nr:DUF4013 domain-containing protein [Anaerolineae bacterium]
MDFMRALTFPFEDADWLKKLGIGVLIMIGAVILSPLLGISTLLAGMLFAGWSFELMKRVKQGSVEPLPGWDFGSLLRTGFKLFVGLLIYQIPTILYVVAVSIALLIPALGGEDLFEVLGTVVIVAISCCSCLIIIYGIFASIVYWGGLIRFIDREEIGTFLQIGDNIALVKNNIGDFGMALVFVILGSIIASLATSITAGLASVLMPIFNAYFSGHILGQLAAKISSPTEPQV